jgi:hypothetical protein
MIVNTEHGQKTLKVFAAITWHIGGVVLLVKGISLLREAYSMNADRTWPWIAIAIGVAVGGLKVKYIFNKSCRKNLKRIDSLVAPNLWQFFRPGFFVALFFMIAAGATLSRMAHGDYAFLISVGALDVALSVALLGSSRVFWAERAFKR